MYISSRDNKEYLIDGILIPKANYKQWELDLGKRPVVQIDDSLYSKLMEHKVFENLVNDGIVYISTEPPASYVNTPEALMEENARLKAQLADMELANQKREELDQDDGR